MESLLSVTLWRSSNKTTQFLFLCGVFRFIQFVELISVTIKLSHRGAETAGQNCAPPTRTKECPSQWLQSRPHRQSRLGHHRAQATPDDEAEPPRYPPTCPHKTPVKYEQAHVAFVSGAQKKLRFKLGPKIFPAKKMRFTFGICHPSGKFETLRGSVVETHPSNQQKYRAVRMEDKEQFRVFFQNDWTIPVSITMRYENTVETLHFEAGEFSCNSSVLTYQKTECGGARALVVNVQVAGKKPYTDGILMMNNAFTKDGLAVHLGQCYKPEDLSQD